MATTVSLRAHGGIGSVPDRRRIPVLTLLLLALIPAIASASSTSTSAKPGILYAVDAKGAVISRSGGSPHLSLPANSAVMCKVAGHRHTHDLATGSFSRTRLFIDQGLVPPL